MYKRVRLWTFLLIMLAGAGLAAIWWATAETPGVTQTNFLRLQHDMTLVQVERILGRAADHTFQFSASLDHVWFGEEGTVYIQIGSDNRSKNFGTVVYGAFQVETHTANEVDALRNSRAAAREALFPNRFGRPENGEVLNLAFIRHSLLDRIRRWFGL